MRAPELSDVDARVLRSTSATYERTVERIAGLAVCSPDVAVSVLRRLRGRMLVEVDGSRPSRWLRTHSGDYALEHTP